MFPAFFFSVCVTECRYLTTPRPYTASSITRQTDEHRQNVSRIIEKRYSYLRTTFLWFWLRLGKRTSDAAPSRIWYRIIRRVWWSRKIRKEGLFLPVYRWTDGVWCHYRFVGRNDCAICSHSRVICAGRHQSSCVWWIGGTYCGGYLHGTGRVSGREKWRVSVVPTEDKLFGFKTDLISLAENHTTQH